MSRPAGSSCPTADPSSASSIDGDDAARAASPRWRASTRQLQLDLAPHVDELLALGVADMRPARMARAVRRGPRRGPARATRTAARAGRGARPRRRTSARRFGDWCERLAGAPGVADARPQRPPRRQRLRSTGRPARSGPLLRLGRRRGRAPLRQRPRPAVGGAVAPRTSTPRRPSERRDPRCLPRAVRVARLRTTSCVEVVDVACEVGKVARSLVWARAVAPMPPGRRRPGRLRVRARSTGCSSSSTARSRRPEASAWNASRLPAMAEQETKSIIVTQAVQDYAVAHRHAAGRGAAVADRRDARARRRSVDDADLARAGRVHDAADPAGRRPLRGRGRHLHRATRRSASPGAWPTAAGCSAAT